MSRDIEMNYSMPRNSLPSRGGNCADTDLNTVRDKAARAWLPLEKHKDARFQQ
jgi:hypothetical protein